MAEVLHMPRQTPRKGRPRKLPIKGTPLAHVINDVDFREANEPTCAEIKASIDKLTFHLLQAGRVVMETSSAYRG